MIGLLGSYLQIALAAELILPCYSEYTVTLTSLSMTRNFLSTKVLIRYVLPLSCDR